MSQFYTSKRTKNLYNPQASEPFKLSRSKLENFLNCPRCFYIDRRLGVGQPPGFPFNLNSAVDHLLKKEFDAARAGNRQHPLQEKYNLPLKPFPHKQLDQWRENFVGISAFHEPSGLILSGAVDDLWQNDDGKIYIVDYKATSKDTEVSLDADWQRGYKNQVEIYQWLFRANGFEVSNIAYFVYCNGRRDAESFDGKLEFDVRILPYTGKADWIDAAMVRARKCLDGELPPFTSSCDYCQYQQAALSVTDGLPTQSMSKVQDEHPENVESLRSSLKPLTGMQQKLPKSPTLF